MGYGGSEKHTRPSPIAPTVDFELDGVQHGFLRLPYSRDDSAWGTIMIPIAVIRNGSGPTALMTGANHGDEYEGAVALFDLANTLRAEDVRGRIITVPAMNYPAFRVGRRTSPIDGGNMNRAFPGRPDGTVTEKIADYFQRTLLPMADYVLDLHSGGKTLDFVPLAAAHVLSDQGQQTRCFEAMTAFSAPFSLRMTEIDTVGMYDTAAEEMGKVFVTTELGGGGTTSPRTLSIARRGVRNFLKHAGVLSGRVEKARSVFLDMPGDDCFMFSEADGLFEVTVELGGAVRKGDVVARVYPVSRTGRAPIEYRAGLTGMLMARHFPGLVQTGDCVAVVAVPES
jgi:N-alpha-acetyl-L-2,4-diaminobutyrate deacetylase